MSNHISHASLPFPIKNARYTLLIPYLDADGDPTDPTTPDTEISQDGGAFADAAEEMTTITGSNGMGYITLTGAETNNSAVGVACKVASGPKATLATLYPRNLPTLASGTASAGASGSITLASSITYDLTGCFVRTTGGTGGGGTGGASNQARRITAYNTSTQVATVTPNWETTPDNTTTYDVLLPEGVTAGMVKTLNPTTAGNTLDVSSGGEAGLDWANVGSPTTAVGLTGTTISTSQAVASVSGAVGSVTGNVGGNVTGSVGSISGVTFPSNFSALAITAGGIVDADLETIKGQAVTCAAGVTVLASVGTAATSTAQTGDCYARLGAPAGASVSADVAAVKADTAAILTDTGTTLEGHLTDIKGATFDGSTDSLEAIRNRGDAAWTTATGFSTHSAADVWAVATRVLTANTNLNDPTAAAIADAVWDEVLSWHLTAGSTGNALNAAGSAGDPWSTALPGAYGAGTAGKIVGDNLNATISSRSSHSAADVWAAATRTLTSLSGLTVDTVTTVTNGVTVTTNNDKTGYSLTQAFPSNFSALAITVGGAVTAGTVSDKTGYSISGTTTTLDALQTALNSAHGAGSWATATGFSTHSAADVWASATRTLTSLSGLTVDTVTTLTNLPAITSNWLTAAGLAADAVAEIQSGLSTLDAAGVRTAVGLASANLDTQIGTLATAANLATLSGYVDTEVAAIKAKTDSLTFTVAGKVDSNIAYVNGVAVGGAGTGGDPWGPA